VAQSNFIFDAVSDCSIGIDSGSDPFILPRNKFAFATNATVRGNFIKNRPPYQLKNFTYVNSGIQSGVESALFQGACYYSPLGNPEQLIAQIGGRLFTFTPDADSTNQNVPVKEISIPGDLNPATQQQAWLIQAERFVIVNDGLSTPIFYDGVSSRRSRVNVVSQGITSNTPFSSPPIGGTVDVTMSAPYTGIVGQALQLVEYDTTATKNVIATSSYVVTAIGSPTSTIYQIVLKNLTDSAGAPHSAGEQLVIKNNYVGVIATQSTISPSPPSGGVYTFVSTISFTNTIPSAVHVGNAVRITGQDNNSQVWTVSSIAANRLSGTFTLLTTSFSIFDPKIGTTILKTGSSSDVVAGVLKGGFLAPSIGVSTSTTLESAFTYAAGQRLFLGLAQYEVVSSQTIVGSGATVTLQNLDDGRGSTHQFNPSTPTTFPAELFNFPELPAGRMMAYGMGRVWESLTDGVSFIAGDIVGGSSGSPAYNYKDAVLKVSENTYLAGGGSFSTPSNLGQITAMRFTAQLDASLGQGALMVVTPGGIFSCNTPVDRTTWQDLTSPILSESLIGLGGLSQNSSIVCNGDLIFRAVDGIRSLIMAKREFYSWGNTPISFEMSRVINADNISLLSYASAAQFDNRLLMTAQPVAGNLGVYHSGLIALNFDPISSIQGKSASVYDGLWNGINVLQIIEGQFSGVHRCFAFTYSIELNKIQLVEILKNGYLDNGTDAIVQSFETPVLFRQANGKGFFDLLNLEDGEFYVSDIQPNSTIHFKIEYRPDFSSVWFPWHEFDLTNPSATTISYGARLGLGSPTSSNCNTVNQTNANNGRWFQLRFTITGHCVFKGVKLASSGQPQSTFAKPICNTEIS